MDAVRSMPDKALAGVVVVPLGLLAVGGGPGLLVAAFGVGLIAYGYVARSQAQRQEMIELLRAEKEQPPRA